MPVIMKRKFNITGNYTDYQKEILEELIQLFRVSVSDTNPDKNILNKKAQHYTDDEIIALLNRAMHDINGGQPLTHISIYEFAKQWDNTLIVDGAVIFALIGEGLLQVRNQVNFNDSGLSIGIFDKTQIYQGWASFLIGQYIQAKSEFKQAYITANQPSIFHGISSEFSYYYWE